VDTPPGFKVAAEQDRARAAVVMPAAAIVAADAGQVDDGVKNHAAAPVGNTPLATAAWPDEAMKNPTQGVTRCAGLPGAWSIAFVWL